MIEVKRAESPLKSIKITDSDGDYFTVSPPGSHGSAIALLRSDANVGTFITREELILLIEAFDGLLQEGWSI